MYNLGQELYLGAPQSPLPCESDPLSLFKAWLEQIGAKQRDPPGKVTKPAGHKIKLASGRNPVNSAI